MGNFHRNRLRGPRRRRYRLLATACLGATLAAFAPHLRCCHHRRVPLPSAALYRLALDSGPSSAPLPDSLLPCALAVLRAGEPAVRRSRPDAALDLAVLTSHMRPGALTEYVLFLLHQWARYLICTSDLRLSLLDGPAMLSSRCRAPARTAPAVGGDRAGRGPG